MYKTQQFETGIQESQTQNDKCSPTASKCDKWVFSYKVVKSNRNHGNILKSLRST